MPDCALAVLAKAIGCRLMSGTLLRGRNAVGMLPLRARTSGDAGEGRGGLPGAAT